MSEPDSSANLSTPSDFDFLSNLVERIISPCADDPLDALVAAMVVWSAYPFWGRKIAALTTATADEKRRLRDERDYAHDKAVEYLSAAAERAGLNSAPLSESARVCRELYSEPGEAGTTETNSGLDGWQNFKRADGMWPACLGAARYSLPATMQEAIRSGSDVYHRLVTWIDLQRASDCDTVNVIPNLADG